MNKPKEEEKMSLQDEFDALVKEGEKKDEERMKNLSRGQGQGVGGPKQGDGGADKCKCPECGKVVSHNKGTPCNEMECPKCGANMVGM